MEKLLRYIPHFVLAVGIWTVANGLLHEVFVLLSPHAAHYNRNLLRLLVDGLVLLFCGTVLLFLFSGLKQNQRNATYIAIVCSLFMLVYCALIWPFLKTWIMVLLHAFLLGLLFYSLTVKSKN
jgi:hypothetical protein